MNIAIYSHDFGWAGGVDFLHFLVKGLLSQRKRDVKLYVLIYMPGRRKKTCYKRSVAILKQGVRVARSFRDRTTSSINNSKTKQPEQSTGYNFVKNLEEIFSNENVTIVYYTDNSEDGKLNTLKSIRADIILPILNTFPADFPIPWVGYLFDFVYKYYTHLYTKDFCLRTDIKYANSLLNAEAVIVNSKATFNDIYKYFPYAKAKVYALPFAPFANQHIYKAAIAENLVLEKYRLKNKYFIISNQFWLHKAHETAFEALSILRNEAEYGNVELVCTGSMTDLSGTDIRRLQLLNKIEELGLVNSIHFLGHISKTDQLALMLRSLAVVQPTLFEGGPGGGSVYMAVANGVPAIVSDIAVNKEIEDEPLVTFFEAGNATDLGKKMKCACSYKIEIKDFEQLEKRNQIRLEKVGDTLLSCIDHTSSSYKRTA